MCGRYSLATLPETLAERFDVRVPADLEPRYNCAPGQDLPVITAPDRMERLEWGLVPRWAAADSRASINARSETITERPSFAEAVERRRCLVPADGFCEWPGSGRPHRVAFADDRPFAMAGIWERWTPPTVQAGLDDFGTGGVEPRETFAVAPASQRPGRRPPRPDGGRPRPRGRASVARGAPGGGPRSTLARPTRSARTPRAVTTSRTTRPT